MKINIKKPESFPFLKKKRTWFLITNCMNLQDCIRDLGVLIDSKLPFHQQEDNIFSQAVRLFGLIRSASSSISLLHRLLTLYCTLVTPKMEYASVAWNSITLSDACKLQRIQQKFISHFHLLFLFFFFLSFELRLW